MKDLDVARLEYIRVLPDYGELVAVVKKCLEDATRQRGIQCVVSVRTKEIGSYVKKVLKKKSNRPLDEIGDKAGARVIVTFPDQLPDVHDVISREFRVLRFEDKVQAYSYDKFSYLGRHYDVVLPCVSEHVRLRDLPCEIQVHTKVENAWSEVSHKLSYKSPRDPLPDEIRRRIHRLVALVELFDQEIDHARQEIRTLPGYESAALLIDLEAQFCRLTGKEYDRELSLLVLECLKGLLSSEERATYTATLLSYVETHKEEIERIYADAVPDDEFNPFLLQPESLFIFERLEDHEFSMVEAWEECFPIELLEELAVQIGHSVSAR